MFILIFLGNKISPCLLCAFPIHNSFYLLMKHNYVQLIIIKILIKEMHVTCAFCSTHRTYFLYCMPALNVLSPSTYPLDLFHCKPFYIIPSHFTLFAFISFVSQVRICWNSKKCIYVYMCMYLL